MHVVLFRHGPAGHADAERWPDDSLRPLTSRGIERTRAAARGIALLEPRLTVVFSSPFLRALATAQLLADTLGNPRFETLDALGVGGPSRPVLAALEKLQSDLVVALVGHEPDLGLLAARLIGATNPLPLKKAGACCIEFDSGPSIGHGTMKWFAPPRMLRRVGRGHTRLEERRA
jgi:phosphohistidine phosphatase